MATPNCEAPQIAEVPHDNWVNLMETVNHALRAALNTSPIAPPELNEETTATVPSSSMLAGAKQMLPKPFEIRPNRSPL